MESQLLDTIGKMYDTVGAESGWDEVLTDIGDLSGGAASLLMGSFTAKDAKITSPYYDPEFTHACLNEWASVDETLGAIMAAPVGATVTLDTTGRERFFKGEFYNEFWSKSEHGGERLRANLLKHPNMMVGFGLNPFAQRDEITRNMRDTYDALLPHLIRSVQLHWRLYQSGLENSLSQGAKNGGTIVVNKDARILTADPQAEECLMTSNSIFSTAGTVITANHNDTNSLHRMIQSCEPRSTGFHLRGGSATLQYPNRDRLLLTVLPASVDAANPTFGFNDIHWPAALVIVENLSKREAANKQKLKELFALTDAEIKVAIGSASATRRHEIATNLGITEATVRTHLSRIYEKTGTSRRAELVALLFREGLV